MHIFFVCSFVCFVIRHDLHKKQYSRASKQNEQTEWEIWFEVFGQWAIFIETRSNAFRFIDLSFWFFSFTLSDAINIFTSFWMSMLFKSALQWNSHRIHFKYLILADGKRREKDEREKKRIHREPNPIESKHQIFKQSTTTKQNFTWNSIWFMCWFFVRLSASFFSLLFVRSRFLSQWDQLCVCGKEVERWIIWNWRYFTSSTLIRIPASSSISDVFITPDTYTYTLKWREAYWQAIKWNGLLFVKMRKLDE